MKIAFFDTKGYDKKYFEKFNKDFNFEITFFETKLDLNSVPLTHGFDAVCIFVNDQANMEVIEQLYQNGVKIIALRCAGYNNVDLDTAEKYSIPVVRVPAYSPYAVAEHTISLILTLNRKIHKSYSRTREGNFSLNGLMGFDMNGKTAGIIGTGKIAQIVINILKGFGMRVLAYDPYPNKVAADKLGFEYVELDQLYSESDIISLHCPLNEDTKYIINEESIEKMKDGVMLINTGRGLLIDSIALINGLKTSKIGYAGLDVYEEEAEYFFEDFSDRLIGDDTLARLLSFNNVLVTSHQAFFTQEAIEAIAKTTLYNIEKYVNGKPLENRVSR
jgi:D-lactate dehydrogenase